MMKNRRPFHLAIPVNDLDAARAFYAIEFVIEPTIRFKGEVGEQATMFFEDPAGNHIELKAFASLEQLFAR